MACLEPCQQLKNPEIEETGMPVSEDRWWWTNVGSESLRNRTLDDAPRERWFGRAACGGKSDECRSQRRRMRTRADSAERMRRLDIARQRNCVPLRTESFVQPTYVGGAGGVQEHQEYGENPAYPSRSPQPSPTPSFCAVLHLSELRCKLRLPKRSKSCTGKAI